MPFIALIIGVVIIILLVAIAMFFGMIGAVAHGPKPSEGDDSTG